MKKSVVGSVFVNHGCIKCHCRLPWRIWCCRPSQWASGVRWCGRRCVCVRATGTCRVLSIGSPVSLVMEQKLSKDSRKKSEYLIYKQKVGVTLKRGNILRKTEWLADVSYCTQLFHRLCCETLKHHPGTANALFETWEEVATLDRRPPLMRAWDGVTAWERGERQSVTGAKAVRLNLS